MNLEEAMERWRGGEAEGLCSESLVSGRSSGGGAEGSGGAGGEEERRRCGMGGELKR